MTILDATIRRPLIPTMAEIKDAVQNVRTDARTLWLPLGTILVVLLGFSGTLLAAGMWIERTNKSAASTETISSELKTFSTQLATMQGSINTLTAMQSTLAETKAQVGALNSRLDNMDTAIQAQNAWIMTTRERLSRQGFETPEFKPKGE